MTDPCAPLLIECPTTMDAASLARLEAMAYRFGRSYDSYLVMDLDRTYFWSSGGRAVLGFVLQGLHAVVIGGLIGPDEAGEALLTEFMDHCRRHGWTACFGLVPEHDLPRMALPSANAARAWAYVFCSSARNCSRGRCMSG